MRQTSLNAVYQLAQKDDRIYFIGSDLGKGTLEQFKNEFPTRFLMEGVSEAHIIGMAAGIAMEGGVVFMNTIATFFARRGYEQIVLDLSLHNLPVRLISSGGGLVYAPLGPTHLAIEDIAVLRTVPNLTIIAPADATEMKRVIDGSINIPGPIYIRLGKGGDPIVTTDDTKFSIGKASIYGDGKDTLIITTGITLQIAIDALKMTDHSKCTILHYHTIKPFDHETLRNKATSAKKIISIEEGVLNGGLGSQVLESLCDARIMPVNGVSRIGISDKFPTRYGSQATQLADFGITAEELVKIINSGY